MKLKIIPMIGGIAAMLFVLQAMPLRKTRRAFLVSERFVVFLYYDGKFVGCLKIEESGAS
jgi:hypothetical protein